MDGVRAGTVCVRGGERPGYCAEVRLWGSPEEACEALATLFDVRCGQRCRMHHLAVVFQPADDPANERWRVIGAPPPPPPPLAQELAAIYPRNVSKLPPYSWPAPPELNPPLSLPVRPNATGQRISNGQRVALARALAHVAL